MSFRSGLLLILVGVSASAVPVAAAEPLTQPITVATSFMTVEVSIPDGALDGPECTELPYTVTFSRNMTPGQVSGTVDMVYVQNGSGIFNRASLPIEPGSPMTGSRAGELTVCADAFKGDEDLVEVDLSLTATNGSDTVSASTEGSFYVTKTPAIVEDFRATSTTVQGTIQAQTKRFGAIPAVGKAIVWFRPPGKKFFSRLGISELDPRGRFLLPTNGRVPARSLLKVSGFDCYWCEEASAKTRSRVTKSKPETPDPSESGAQTTRQYYLSRGGTQGIAIQLTGRRTVAAFPAVGDSISCFKGTQRGRPALGGGVMYVGQRMTYTLGKPTKWKTYWFSIESQPQARALFEDPWNVDRPYLKSSKPALVRQWGAGALKACGIKR